MTYKGRLLGLLGVLTLAVAAGMPAQASVINYGVVPIGGTPSFTSPTGFLQDATIFNLGGGTDTVNLVSPGDASGLIPGSVVHVSAKLKCPLSAKLKCPLFGRQPRGGKDVRGCCGDGG